MASCATFGFGEPDQFAASARGARLELLVTAPGQYQADLTRVNFGQLWMQRTAQSLPFIARASGDRSRYVVIFYEAGQPSMQNSDTEFGPGDLLIDAYNSEQYFRTMTASRSGSMSLAPNELAEIYETLAGRELRPRQRSRLARPPANLTARLVNLHKASIDLAMTAPEIFGHSEVAKAMEQALVHALTRCLMDRSAGDDHARSVLSSTTVMRRFEQVLERREGEPLYLVEICQAIGVTDRTLRAHCQEHLGMSPHRYLWLRRMHLARRALTLADRSTTTVANIANDCGFGELGRFAVAYRELFVESPSITLRREPRTARPSSGKPGQLISEFA